MVTKLEYLRKMPLRYVDLTGVVCNDYTFLKQIKSLEQVVCSPRQREIIENYVENSVKIEVVQRK